MCSIMNSEAKKKKKRDLGEMPGAIPSIWWFSSDTDRMNLTVHSWQEIEFSYALLYAAHSEKETALSWFYFIYNLWKEAGHSHVSLTGYCTVTHPATPQGPWETAACCWSQARTSSTGRCARASHAGAQGMCPGARKLNPLNRHGIYDII